MTLKNIIKKWVDAFNSADAAALADLYSEDAVNHQVMFEPVKGKTAIRTMFKEEFARTGMTCIPEQVLQDGEWVILEWKDPLGLRGCGFFRIMDEKIVFQRGYWDRLSFLRQHNIPVPGE